MARLTCKAMGNPTFTQVVGTKNHTAIVSHPIGGLEELHWINTNKLLDEGWDGVKTGITPNAGTQYIKHIIRSLFDCLCYCEDVGLQ